VREIDKEVRIMTVPKNIIEGPIKVVISPEMPEPPKSFPKRKRGRPRK